MSDPTIRFIPAPGSPWRVIEEAPPAPAKTELPYAFDATLIAPILPGKRQWRPADPATGFTQLGIDHQHLKGGRAQCPQCDDGKYNLSLDFNNGLYHCYRCDWAGNATHQHDHRPDAAQIQRQSEQRQAEQIQRGIKKANAAWNAQRQWEALAKTGGHQYLEKKGVAGHGIRYGKDAYGRFIAIPMRRIDGQLVGLQKIYGTTITGRDTDRLFSAGVAKVGAMHVLGRMDDDVTEIQLGEGYSTCASAYEATGIVTVCAFDAGNLQAVAEALRARYPNARITLLADNDIRKPGSSTTINTGIQKATNAALAIDGWIAVPEMDGTKCDWNDVHAACGLDAVAAGIAQAQPVKRPESPIQTELSAQEASAKLQAEIDHWLSKAGTGHQYSTAIFGAAGLGKTTALLSAIRARQHQPHSLHDDGTPYPARPTKVDYFVPSFELAQEQVDRLPPGQAAAMRGRTHSAKDLAPPCAKSEAMKGLQRIGQGHRAMQLLCGKAVPGMARPCPHSAGCEYLRQFNSTAPIRFMAHEWLPLKPAKMIRGQRGDPDLVAIDEKFNDAIEARKKWSVARLFEAGDVWLDLAEAIRDDALIERFGDRKEELAKILEEAEESIALLLLYPEMSAIEAQMAIEKWEEEGSGQGQPYGFIRAVLDALMTGHTKRLHYVPTVSKKKDLPGGMIHYAGIKPMEFLPDSAPVAFLDATGNRMVIEKAKPGTRIVEIQAKRNAIIIQLMDSALSAHRLKENNAHLQERIAELIQRIIQHYGPAGMMIGPMGFISEMTGNGYVPESVLTAHFNALRGLNSGEHQHWGLMIGRNEPDAYSIETQARAWFADEPDFKPGTVFRGPTPLMDKTGKTVMVTTTQFADPYCQALMEQAREAESIQALDRLRLVHADQPKIVFILSNQPLPGITPDHLVKLDELLLPGRIATVMLRDNAITGPATMAQRHPDLFKDQQAAKDALSEALMGDFPNRIYIGKSPIIDTDPTPAHDPHADPENPPAKDALTDALIPRFPNRILIGKRGIIGADPTPPALAEIRYRTAGQRGKHRVAWLYPSADPITILSAIHGEPITLISEPKHEAHFEYSDFKPEYSTESAPATGNLIAALGQPFVATHEADPPPIPDSPPIAPTAPAVAPTAATGEVTMKKPGNIENLLGSPFFADWERTEPARSVSWVVQMTDGNTCVLRDPENPTYAEAYETARRMIPTAHHVSLPRQWAG